MNWFKKKVICIYNAIYSAIEKKGIFSFLTTWMDLEGIMPTEVSETEKDK